MNDGLRADRDGCGLHWRGTGEEMSVRSCGQKSAIIHPGSGLSRFVLGRRARQSRIHADEGNSLRHGFTQKVSEIQFGKLRKAEIVGL